MFFSTMAMAFGRTLVSKTHLSTYLSRCFTTTNRFSTSTLLRFRPLVILAEFRGTSSLTLGIRSFATSSLNDPSPNFSNPLPKKRILLDGCDFEHWLVFLEKPPEEWTRVEIINYCINTLAQVVGSEEEAHMKIYYVTIGYYLAFGALVSEEMSYKLKKLEKVRLVLPDVRNKDYGEFRGTPSLPVGSHSFATLPTSSPLNEPSPNFNNRGLKNTIPWHWLVVLEEPPKEWTRDLIIDYYVKTLAQAVGSEKEARMKIFSVSTRGYFTFGALVSKEMSYKLKKLKNVRSVLPDPYLDLRNKDYEGRSRNFERIIELMDMQNNSLNMVGMPPRNAGCPNNAPHAVNIPNQDYQHTPSGGGAPYQNREAPGAMPNRGFQNNGYAPGGNMGGAPSGNQYQVRDIPGRDQYYQH